MLSVNTMLNAQGLNKAGKQAQSYMKPRRKVSVLCMVYSVFYQLTYTGLAAVITVHKFF
jgi:hypothetical protein